MPFAKSECKYTNPVTGILDFCKQKFCRPLLCRQWTRGPQNNWLGNQPSADFSGTERKKEEIEEIEEKEHDETKKGPPPGGA